MSSCFLYHIPSSDFTLDASDLPKLLTSIGPSQQDVVILNSHFQFTAITSPLGSVDFELTSSSPEDHDFGILIQDLLRGLPITITESNAHFLEDFSRSYNLDGLHQHTLTYLNFPKSYLLSFLLRIRDFVLHFFGGFGFFGRLMFTFWDLFGVLVVLSCLINLSVSLVTMGLYKIANEGAIFVFILLPYCLFILTFSSLFSMPVLEFLEFRFFRAGEAFFAKHQQLILTFLSVTPLNVKRKAPFSLGKYFDSILGLLFFVFGLAILVQIAFIVKISYGVEAFILIFAVGIPPIKYFALYFLYALHSVASIFNSCRSKFLENKNFDDPFLCSIYFGRTAFRDFWHSSREDRTLLFIVQTLFSKSSAAVYLVLASSIFLITQSSILSVGQVFGFIFIVFLLAIPLCCTISFPFFLLENFRIQKPTDLQVKREFAKIGDSPREVFYRYVAYSNQHQILRSTSILTTAFCIFVVIFAFVIGIAPSSAAKVLRQPSAQVLTDERHRVTHAICDATVKNLSVMQIGYLEHISETINDTEEFNTSIGILPAVFGWKNLSDFRLIETPFPNNIGAFLRHFVIRDRKLHVLAISGTKSFVDILVDVELWAASALMSVFRPFIPFLAAFSHFGRGYLNELLALPRGVFRPLSIGELYIQSIVSYIGTIDIEKGESVVLTGHSLGGGIAKAVALTTGFATVAWSGPGTSGLEGIFGGTKTRPNIVSISPEQDWMAPIDPSDGTVFRLPCRAGFMGCHDLKRMLCQMAALCGTFDVTRAKCEKWFEPNEIQDMFELGQPVYLSPS